MQKISCIQSSPALDLGKEGTVGLCSYAGAGNRYWAPVTVVDTAVYEGANIAYENFSEDTIVDVKPYTPWHWNSVKNSIFQDTSVDTAGFVFDNSNGSALLYRNSTNTTVDNFPAICILSPKSNLEWKNYEYSGSIIKPAGSMYDSVEVSIPFYFTNTWDRYKLIFNLYGVSITGGKYSNTYLNSMKFNNGDTLWFDIIVDSKEIGGIADSSIEISAKAKKNGGGFIVLLEKENDATSSRQKVGYGGIEMGVSDNKYKHSSFNIKARNIIIKKHD